MQTRQEGMLDFLSQDACFVIPVYQRAYAWTELQCEELLADIMRAGRMGTSHFLSMILFLENPDHEHGNARSLDIIDGQQRIATMTILLLALERHLRGTGKESDLAIADDIRARYLIISPDGLNTPEPKAHLMGLDGTTLRSLLFDKPLPAKPSQRVVENYQFFCNKMAEDSFNAQEAIDGLRQLLVIDAEIDENDKAQPVFESLNTKGIPLTTADLVRNYLLVGETRAEQERLYNEYWHPMELMFGDDAGGLKMNAGIRMWLSIRFRARRIHNKSQTYSVFKSYMTEEFSGTTEELLEELRGFCLMWSENYKFNEVKEFRSMDWIKGKTKTLIPGWGHQSGF